jgi:hypothetical protein
MSPETDGSVLDNEPNAFLPRNQKGRILNTLLKLKNSGLEFLIIKKNPLR